jgi:hypothetical protein
VRWWAGSGRCRARAGAVSRGRRTPRCSGSRRASWSTGSSQRCSRRAGPRRRPPVAGRRSGGLHPAGRGRRPTPDRGGEGARPRRRRRPAAIDRLDFTAPAARPRGDAPRDLPAGPPAGHPAHPGAPRRRRGPLDFRRTVARLDLHRRRPWSPPQAEAPAPHTSWSCCAT